MTLHVAGAAALVAVLTLGACGTTYVDTTVTTIPEGGTTTTTLPPIDPHTPVDQLLVEIETLMINLDERIIETDGHVVTLARIDELWYVAEVQIREVDPGDVFNFAQAIDLARSAVERNRPADASKGYKIFTDVVDDYLDR